MKFQLHKIKLSFRALLYNIVSIINNNVLYNEKFVKKIDIMLTVLSTTKKERKGGRSLGGNKGWEEGRRERKRDEEHTRLFSAL